jgi:predicted nucleic acid-binding protein
MKKTIIVDAGIIIEYLKTGKGVLPTAYENYKMVIAATTYAALLASTTFEDGKLESEVMDFIDKYFSVKEVNKTVAYEAAKIIRRGEINMASAITAAMAKQEGYSLLTDNAKTYEKVEGIELLSL